MSVSAASESRASDSTTELVSAPGCQSTAPTSVCDDSAHPQTPKQRLAQKPSLQLGSPLSPHSNRGIPLITRGRLGAQSPSRTPSFTVHRPNHNGRAYSSDDLGSFKRTRTTDIIDIYAHNTSSSIDLTPSGRSRPLPQRPSPARIYQLSSGLRGPKSAKTPLSTSFSTLKKRLFSKSKDKGGDISRGPYTPPHSPQQDEFGYTPNTSSHSSEIGHELSRAPSQLRQVLNHATGRRHDYTMGGELLYFATGLDPPSWQRCNASLYSAHLNLNWHNPDGSQGSQFFKLSDLGDVYSVCSIDLNPSFLREGEISQGFEAVFGGKIERFAALTSQGRWDWVAGLFQGRDNCRRNSSAAVSSVQPDSDGSIVDLDEHVPLRVVNADPCDFSFCEEPESVADLHETTPRQAPLSHGDEEARSMVLKRVAAIEERFGSTSAGSVLSPTPSQRSGQNPRATAREIQNRILEPNSKGVSTMLQNLDGAFGVRRTPSPGVAPLRVVSTRTRDSGALSTVPPPPIDKDSIYLDRLAHSCDLASTQEHTTDDEDHDNPLERHTIDLHPLYSLLNRQSTDQFSTTNQINAQLTDLRSDVSRIVLDVNAALKGRHAEPRLQRVEDQLNNVLSGLAKLDLQPVHAKLDNVLAKSQPIEQDMSNVPRRNRPLPPIVDLTPVVSSIEDLKKARTRPSPPIDFSPVLERMDEAGIIQQSHHQVLLQKVEELAAHTPPESLKEPEPSELRDMLSNILKHVQTLAAPSPISVVTPTLPSPPEAPAVAVIVKDNEASGPATISHANVQPSDSPDSPSDPDGPPDPGVAQVLAKVESLLAASTLSEQRAMDLRGFQESTATYLSELNKWMEEYTGTAGRRIEAMGSDIHNLCTELGLTPATSPAVPTEGSGEGTAGEPQTPPNLVQGLRSLLAAQPAQRQELAYLTATVGGLEKTMEESTQTMKNEPKEVSDVDKLGAVLAEHRQATAALLQSALEQQSQRNEAMVRHAVAELANGIRQDITMHVLHVQREAVDHHLAEMRQQVGNLYAESNWLMQRNTAYLAQLKDITTALSVMGAPPIPNTAALQPSQALGPIPGPVPMPSPQRQAHQIAQQPQPVTMSNLQPPQRR